MLEDLKTIEERKFPALLLRIDSPGGTVGDSQEIYSALKRLQKTPPVAFILVWEPNILWQTQALLPEVLV